MIEPLLALSLATVVAVPLTTALALRILLRERPKASLLDAAASLAVAATWRRRK